MKGFNLAASLARGDSNPMLKTWTCRQCMLQTRGTKIPQFRGYARRSNGYARPRRKGRVVLAAAAGGLGVSALAFGDDVKHAYGAMERTGRVISTLAVCIN